MMTSERPIALPHSHGMRMARASAGPATMATVTSIWDACTTGCDGGRLGRSIIRRRPEVSADRIHETSGCGQVELAVPNRTVSDSGAVHHSTGRASRSGVGGDGSRSSGPADRRRPCQDSRVLINRVTELLGVEIPIVQAPMGWIARSQPASAGSNAGAMGIIETSSGELDAVRGEIAKMKDLTDRPFGVNIAQAFVADPEVIVDFVIAQGVRFVTTSAGSPTRYTAQLKDAGLTVFHVVPTLRAAAKAVDAGVDGLIVEGGEGGGFKNPRPVSTMVLLPSVTAAFDVPVIAAGGFLDGPTMAAALALGAEGVQLGTVMVSSAESPG